MVFGSSEFFDDSMVFFNELVNFDSGLVQLYHGLGLLCQEFVLDLINILKEVLSLIFKLSYSEFQLF